MFAGAPGPPGVPIIVRYSSAIAIHWSSGDPGKGPITRYVIEARPSGMPCPGRAVLPPWPTFCPPPVLNPWACVCPPSVKTHVLLQVKLEVVLLGGRRQGFSLEPDSCLGNSWEPPQRTVLNIIYGPTNVEGCSRSQRRSLVNQVYTHEALCSDPQHPHKKAIHGGARL